MTSQEILEISLKLGLLFSATIFTAILAAFVHKRLPQRYRRQRGEALRNCVVALLGYAVSALSDFLGWLPSYLSMVFGFVFLFLLLLSALTLDHDWLREIFRPKIDAEARDPPDQFGFLSAAQYERDLVDAAAKMPLPLEVYIPVIQTLGAGYRQWLAKENHHLWLRDYSRWYGASLASLQRFTDTLPPLSTAGLLNTRLGNLFAGSSFPSTIYSALERPFIEVGYSDSGCFRPYPDHQSAQHKILEIMVSVAIPEESRFQHTWIIAPTGTGKTNLIEQLIVNDLPQVMAGRASLFVMDSQNELISRIASQVPPEKLVFLEPDDRHPLALNIFDSETIDYATSLELADFVMAGLVGADLTAKQKGIFRYLTEAMQTIPNATIHTFVDLLRKGGYDRYHSHLERLDPYTRQFFEERFNATNFNTTKEEITWRIDAIMSNRIFRQMFSHARNRVNLYDELGRGKVVCINTNRDILKAEGTEIFGRFFLAMLLQATERRMQLPPSQRLPVYAYIDECHDYIAREPKIASLLDKARKQRVAFILAHQRTKNIEDKDVLDALANAKLKFAGKNRTDAAYLAGLMGMEPEQLANLPDWHFAFFGGQKPLTVSVAKSTLSVDDGAMREHRKRMHSLYCAPPEEPQKAPERAPDPLNDPKPIIATKPPAKPGKKPPKKPGDDIDISPTKEW